MANLQHMVSRDFTTRKDKPRYVSIKCAFVKILFVVFTVAEIVVKKTASEKNADCGRAAALRMICITTLLNFALSM